MKGPQAALAAYLKSPKTVTPEKTLKELNQLVPVFEELSVGFPRKYHHFFDRNLQQWIYVHLMLHYIQTGTLLLFNDLLGKLISSGSGGKVNVEVDDYLHAVVSLVNELARFAVVSVIAGNYEMPVAINQFIDDIFTNFQLLNLKNDSLRRRFDSIKVFLIFTASLGVSNV